MLVRQHSQIHEDEKGWLHVKTGAIANLRQLAEQLWPINSKMAVYYNPNNPKKCYVGELPLPCGTVVPMEVASNSRDSYPFLTKRLAVRTNQGIFTYAAIPLTGIPFGFSLWNPYTSGAERNV